MRLRLVAMAQILVTRPGPPSVEFLWGSLAISNCYTSIHLIKTEIHSSWETGSTGEILFDCRRNQFLLHINQAFNIFWEPSLVDLLGPQQVGPVSWLWTGRVGEMYDGPQWIARREAWYVCCDLEQLNMSNEETEARTILTGSQPWLGRMRRPNEERFILMHPTSSTSVLWELYNTTSSQG